MPGVLPGLEQARHVFDLPLLYRFRLGFKSDKFRIIRRNGIPVVFPPTALVRVLGEGHELAATRLRDAVVSQQFLDLVQREATLPKFVAADLRCLPANGLRYRSASTTSAEATQFGREAAPSHRRAASRHANLPWPLESRYRASVSRSSAAVTATRPAVTRNLSIVTL